MTHQVESPKGEIKGTAIVRDKDGNIKGTFEFGGPATKEQVEDLKANGFDIKQDN